MTSPTIEHINAGHVSADFPISGGTSLSLADVITEGNCDTRHGDVLMWLLDAATKQLQSYEGQNVPKYAILSHRWEEEEVLYQDIINGTAHNKKGYHKLTQTCDLARRDGYQYIWIDTCCIDKRSSAELSEAINSMYRWYNKAQICYAYISDVQMNERLKICQPLLGESVWFKRGWTLQELLAPRRLIFYDRNWKMIGNRSQQDICSEIHRVTHIPEWGIQDFEPDMWNVAVKMSWASSRETTRIEDMAYCLLGLFQLNMPLLYGEGPNAFLRLQQELSKSTSDRSLFAWQGDQDPDPLYQLFDTTKLDASSAFFAPHIKCFKHCHALKSLYSWNGNLNWRHSTVAVQSDGLLLEARLWPLFDNVYAAELCETGSRQSLFIFLEKANGELDGGVGYNRVIPNKIWYQLAPSARHQRSSKKSTEILIRHGIFDEFRYPSLDKQLARIEKSDIDPHCGFDVSVDVMILTNETHSRDGQREMPPDSDDDNVKYPNSYDGYNLGLYELRYFFVGSMTRNPVRERRRLRHLTYNDRGRLVGGKRCLSRIIDVPRLQAVGMLGCAYFSDRITQELVILTLGYAQDFTPRAIVQIWPKSLSAVARYLSGFMSRGVGRQIFSQAEKGMFENSDQISKLGKPHARGFRRTKIFPESDDADNMVVDDGRGDVVRFYIATGNAYFPGFRDMSITYSPKKLSNLLSVKVSQERVGQECVEYTVCNKIQISDYLDHSGHWSDSKRGSYMTTLLDTATMAVETF